MVKNADWGQILEGLECQNKFPLFIRQWEVVEDV